VWDREEQIVPLASLIGGVIEPHAGAPETHPLAVPPEKVDGETLARQVDAAESESQGAGLSLAAVSRLRERVADLADRAAWLADDAARAHLLERTARLLDRLGT
jgi:MoxR-like ATPase